MSSAMICISTLDGNSIVFAPGREKTLSKLSPVFKYQRLCRLESQKSFSYYCLCFLFQRLHPRDRCSITRQRFGAVFPVFGLRKGLNTDGSRLRHNRRNIGARQRKPATERRTKAREAKIDKKASVEFGVDSSEVCID